MTYKTDLTLLDAETATGPGGDMLKATKAKMGMVPNMYAGMAHLPALLATYQFGYEKFRAEGGFTPVEQEVVFLAISRFHGCTYCVAAHSFVADTMTKVPTEVTDAIRDGRPIADARLESLRKFTHIMVDSRGNPKDADVAEFHAAGYTDSHLLAIILALSVKTISNFANHVFHTPVDAAFANRAWHKAA